jgi:hypothetical protein
MYTEPFELPAPSTPLFLPLPAKFASLSPFLTSHSQNPVRNNRHHLQQIRALAPFFITLVLSSHAFSIACALLPQKTGGWGYQINLPTTLVRGRPNVRTAGVAPLSDTFPTMGTCPSQQSVHPLQAQTCRLEE